MRVKIFTAVALVAAGAVLTGAALSAEAPRRGRGAGLAALQSEIGLSDEQVAKIRQIHTQERKASIRRNAELRIARVELDELMGAATPDEQAIAARVKAIGELQAQSLQARTESRLAIRRLVTAEQYQKMQQLKRHAQRARRARPARRHMAPQGDGAGPAGGEELSPLGPA